MVIHKVIHIKVNKSGLGEYNRLKNSPLRILEVREQKRSRRAGMEWIRNNFIILKKMGIIVGVYLGMKYLVPLLIPFFIAALFVCWCWPFLRRMQSRFHIRPACTSAVLLLITGLLAAAVISAAGRYAGEAVQKLGEMLMHPGEAERLLYECCDGVCSLLQLDTEKVHFFVTEQMGQLRASAGQKLLPGAFGGSWKLVRHAGSFGAGLLVTVISVVLMAADFEKIREKAREWSFYDAAASVIRGILHSVGGYLRAQGIIMGLVMLLCTAGIWISGAASNPVAAGIGTGLLDALPVFGTGTVFLPWILILVLFQKNYTAALILALTYGACVLTREFLEPKLIGGKLGLFPVVVLASVYAGVKLYGFGGIILGPVSVLLIQELWRQADEKRAEDLRRMTEL